MNILRIPITDLHADPANARRHPQRNLDALAASLKRFGQQKPLVIDLNNIVRAGNGTLAAAKSLGWKQLDCVRSDLPLTEISAYAVADNRTAELAEWDPDALGALLDGMDDAGLRCLAFDDAEELAKLLDRPEPGGPIEPETISEHFEVAVICRDDKHQQEVFNRLTADGESCRLITL